MFLIDRATIVQAKGSRLTFLTSGPGLVGSHFMAWEGSANGVEGKTRRCRLDGNSRPLFDAVPNWTTSKGVCVSGGLRSCLLRETQRTLSTTCGVFFSAEGHLKRILRR